MHVNCCPQCPPPAAGKLMCAVSLTVGIVVPMDRRKSPPRSGRAGGRPPRRPPPAASQLLAPRARAPRPPPAAGPPAPQDMLVSALVSNRTLRLTVGFDMPRCCLNAPSCVVTRRTSGGMLPVGLTSCCSCVCSAASWVFPVQISSVSARSRAASYARVAQNAAEHATHGSSLRVSRLQTA